MKDDKKKQITQRKVATQTNTHTHTVCRGTWGLPSNWYPSTPLI